MAVVERFIFGHEPTDTLEETLALERFRAMGIALGAAVEVWRCVPCRVEESVFRYPEPPAAAQEEGRL